MKYPYLFTQSMEEHKTFTCLLQTLTESHRAN